MRGYCDECGCVRKVEKPKVLHGTFALMSLYTLGLYLPVWLFVSIVTPFQPYKCVCGTAVKEVFEDDGTPLNHRRNAEEYSNENEPPQRRERGNDY